MSKNPFPEITAKDMPRRDDGPDLAATIKAADQGQAEAQADLGFSYYLGQGVPQDYTQAIYWYRKAAVQGHALSQLSLGHMFNDGRGAPQDHRLAAVYYRLAAEQGLAEAQFKLGNMYLLGLGVQMNYRQAVSWYVKADKQGHSAAWEFLRLVAANQNETGKAGLDMIPTSTRIHRKEPVACKTREGQRATAS